VADLGGEVFQIATYSETTVKEIADSIKKIVEKETGKAVEIVHGSLRTGDVKRNFSDISKAKEMLGFEPKVELSRGLKITLDWFLSQPDI
jgi:UDP-glucose 4-epimerase